jgi:transposase-like protein
MTEHGPQNGGRRRKRFLSPSQKYEIWLGLVRGESTISEAADRAGVDRSTVMKVRQVAKQGALEALAASRPGVKANGVEPELAAARVEIAVRLKDDIAHMHAPKAQQTRESSGDAHGPSTSDSQGLDNRESTAEPVRVSQPPLHRYKPPAHGHNPAARRPTSRARAPLKGLSCAGLGAGWRGAIYRPVPAEGVAGGGAAGPASARRQTGCGS